MDRPQIERLIRHPVNHVGFSVRDLETTIEQWARTLGVGPFFVVEDVAFWAQIAEASDRWDGRDPIRPMSAP